MNWYHARMEDWPRLREIASANLDAWKRSGVVKTLKFYSADHADGCAVCERHHEKIIPGRRSGRLEPAAAR